MPKTANSIIRAESWIVITATAPIALVKKFRKALIDSDCTPRQAFIAFMHAVGTGELRLVVKQECKDYRGTGIVSDATGVFDDYRALMKTMDGRVVNPLPFSNDFLEKF